MSGNTIILSHQSLCLADLEIKRKHFDSGLFARPRKFIESTARKLEDNIGDDIILST